LCADLQARRGWARARGAIVALVVGPLLGSVAACGPITSSSAIGDAERAVLDAKKAEASEHAPYEYTKADAYLTKAKWLDGQGQFELSAKYAREAKEAAAQALDVASANRERRSRIKGTRPGQLGPARPGPARPGGTKPKPVIPGPTPSTGAP